MSAVTPEPREAVVHVDPLDEQDLQDLPDHQAVTELKVSWAKTTRECEAKRVSRVHQAKMAASYIKTAPTVQQANKQVHPENLDDRVFVE